MPYPTHLSNLTSREAITDIIHRVCLAIDTNDLPLFDSAWASPPSTVSFTLNDQVTSGLDAMHSGFFKTVGPMDTTHYVTGIRIDVEEGKDEARATANAMNQHFKAGTGMMPDARHLLAGGRYEMEFVREGESGEWRLKEWVFRVVWAQGDWSIMS